jgi:hypothetical protein
VSDSLQPAYPRRQARSRTAGASLAVSHLRHTFASLLLQQGVSPAYVQRQLGHASIQLTVDTYGNKAAVDALDSPSGCKVVGNVSHAGAGDETIQGNPQATRRSRTGDLLIRKDAGGCREVPAGGRTLEDSGVARRRSPIGRYRQAWAWCLDGD